MIELKHADLGYLLFLVRNEYYTSVRELLGNPFSLRGRLCARGRPHETTAALRELRNSEDNELRRSLDLHLITHSLLYRDDMSEWLTNWLGQEVDLNLHFKGMNWERMREASWTVVPVVVVYDKASVVYFIAGLLSGTEDGRLWPLWADKIMDHECKAAIEGAASAAELALPLADDTSFFCFPLLFPKETPQITGRSLGLSLALAFLSLVKSSPLPRNLVASGTLTETRGSIGEVESLEKKALRAEQEGFTVFLYPLCGTPPEFLHRLELLPVKDLREAWMFTQLYSPGKSRELILLSEMLRDPAVFVNNVDMVEPAWLDWLGREHMTEGMLSGILQNPRLSPLLVDKIGWVLKKWNLNRAGSIAALVSETGFTSMASSSAPTALRFCTQNMGLANHRGDVSSAVSWAEAGNQIFKKALKADINACADFLNNRFIVSHNRYEFAPSVPEDLKELLLCLEERYRTQCAGGCVVDRILGELYGSICQSFGFCGPRYLSECEDYAQKAVEAFGSGGLPETREDILRQASYLTYARLDAGDSKKAQAAMFSFLETDGWAELWRRVDEHGLSRWQHALLARFLADAGDGSQRREYQAWALIHRSKVVDQDHPSQLWLHNLGRIAQALDRSQEAACLFEESLKICLEGNLGPTVKVMALLPLSGLSKLELPSSVELDQAKRQVSESAEELNPEYFKILRQEKFEGVLEHVWEKPGQLFPFTYR